MTKAELIAAVAADATIKKVDAEKAVNALIKNRAKSRSASGTAG